MPEIERQYIVRQYSDRSMEVILHEFEDPGITPERVIVHIHPVPQSSVGVVEIKDPNIPSILRYLEHSLNLASGIVGAMSPDVDPEEDPSEL